MDSKREFSASMFCLDLPRFADVGKLGLKLCICELGDIPARIRHTYGDRANDPDCPEVEAVYIQCQCDPRTYGILTSVPGIYGRADSIPEGITTLTSLKELHISGCKLRSVPSCSSMAKLSKLEILKISRCTFTSDGMPDIWEFASSMSTIRELHITGCKLNPLRLCQLDKLEVLKLKYNGYPCAELPDVFQYMPSLKELHIANCPLERIPASVANLNKLALLTISQERFSVGGLPDIFMSSMTSLRVLKIYHSNKVLYQSPVVTMQLSSILNLVGLEVLDLTGSCFSTDGILDIFTSNMTSLRKLYVQMCRLKDLPASISELPNLQVLDISFNDFSSEGLPQIITSMVSLRALHICSCRLINLPASLSKLNNLEVLSLTLNDFSADGLPEVVPSMASLRQLHISHCRLRTVPESISKLKKLEVLNMSHNDFSSSLRSEIFTPLTSLKELFLSNCKLSALPVSIGQLHQLQLLNISANNLITLPNMSGFINLQTLHVFDNFRLEALDSNIWQLSQLKCISVESCKALRYPPYELCEQGFSAIIQYYKDLAKGAGRNLPLVTIAVIGNTMAGKTSLIRTLQSPERKRVLTDRTPEAPVDETTKVFNMEEVRVDNTIIKLVDMGGQEVYHITYQLTLKQNCIPVIVVSMEQYKDVSEASGQREAVRRLAFDWISHLYLANPDLGPPKLVLTHKDKFGNDEFAELRSNFLGNTNEVCRDIVAEEKQLGHEFCLIKHFSDTSNNVFLPDDVYEVGKEEDYSAFDRIKINLLQSSQNFVKPLPKIWEDINEKILTLKTAFNTVDELFDILHKSDESIEYDQLTIILTYMHDSGKVLWYENVENLRSYIFHKITEVTKLLTILYHHNSNVWRERLRKFEPYVDCNGRHVEKEAYEVLVQDFLDTGVIDGNLLRYMIGVETAFKGDKHLKIAISILKSFHLLHGPMNRKSATPRFIVPYFATGFHDMQDETAEELTLRVDLLFKGLSLPQYVYHQMSVGLLELYTDERDSPIVKRNGARVFHGSFDIQLIHDSKSRKSSIQVSSSAANICESWDKLIKITNNTVKHILRTWSASRIVCVCICSHCLLSGNPHPRKTVNPDWSIHSLTCAPQQPKLHMETGIVVCGGQKIPSSLKYPCCSLAERDTDKLQKFVDQLKKDKKASSSSEASSLPVRLLPRLQAAEVEESSELSDDDDDYLQPTDDPDGQNVYLRQKLQPTTRNKIKELFLNTDKVFSMTKVRGRALIINNNKFCDNTVRRGSEADVQNITDMLKAFNFEVITWSDVSAKDMLLVIKNEVKLKDHEDNGMFVLFVLSHGTEYNCIYGSDLQLVNMKDVYDLLTPLNFPGMTDKPKLIVIQACSGGRLDGGKRGVHDLFEEPITEQPEIVRPPTSKIGQQLDVDKLEKLNYDNLLIIRPSFESFVSGRHPTYGSLLIRCLVQTMYKHACHRDMYEIYRIVQHRIRQFCIKRNLESGQVVVAQDTLSHMRKLYLFPGYDGPRRVHKPAPNK